MKAERERVSHMNTGSKFQVLGQPGGKKAESLKGAGDSFG